VIKKTQVPSIHSPFLDKKTIVKFQNIINTFGMLKIKVDFVYRIQCHPTRTSKNYNISLKRLIATAMVYLL